MAEYHRKIELQSPDDLQYLISNARRAANDKIDRDLPPIEGEDKMRRRVEELVQEYISSVFHGAASNITINGLPPSRDTIDAMLANPTSTSSIEEHEPFDTRLFEKAKAAAREEEELIEEIARLRRQNPGAAAESARAAWRQGMEEDEGALRAAVAAIAAKDAGGAWREEGLAGGKLERGDQVERAWRRGVGALEGLKASLPETVAKAERAGKAESYVLGTERR